MPKRSGPFLYPLGLTLGLPSCLLNTKAWAKRGERGFAILLPLHSQNFHHSFSTGRPFFEGVFVTFPIRNCFQYFWPLLE
ncbi:unnamed protein product [Pseudo-nitzschia multistriata]|uniref:Uncharacterized protein n=1 Tax=Pseudo-nitzschia multistriata TaxID=183589 RepID=A0A448ZPY6_9STRA|nr:unnamed protein product [Pseudo-nitzschia multistriata]